MRINYITWIRNDAIGKVTENTLRELNKLDNVNKISLYPKRKVFGFIRNLGKLIKIYFTKGIIHYEDPKNKEVMINIFLRWKKTILTVHHLENKSGGIKGSLEFWIYGLIYKSFNELISISEKTKMDLISQYGIKSNNIKVIYHGIDKSIFLPTKIRPKIIGNKKYILYLGSEIPRKNIRNLLESFKLISNKYPKLFLVKAGYSGGKNYRRDMINIIKELKLTKKVIIVSKEIDERDLSKYYSNAELFLYPSLQEGFGMPIMESMACGCPVVTSDMPPMNEIALEQILVDPNNHNDIANGMNSILSNNKNRLKIKERGINRSRSFDWKISANKILKIYKKLI